MAFCVVSARYTVPCMSTGAEPASGIATYRILRELGSRAQRSYAAIREPHELVVIHRFGRRAVDAGSPVAEGVTALSPEELGLLLRDAQCLAKNWHPNIARIKHVDLVNGDLTIATELVDGATLADLIAITAARRTPFPLDVLARVLVDVLAGAHGIHGLRDATNLPIGAIHGALCPANIVVGRDGVARLVDPLRPRPLRVAAGSEAVGYAAPETLDGGAVDVRADVHAVGVILWEVLTGRRLHDEREPARVLARQREVDIAHPSVAASDSPYAPLADIAMRALSFDPALRFRTAAEMASELRRLPAARIATGSVVAARVNELDGERIRGRRASLDPSSSGSRRRVSAPSIETTPEKKAKQHDAPPASRGERITLTPPSSVALPASPSSTSASSASPSAASSSIAMASSSASPSASSSSSATASSGVSPSGSAASDSVAGVRVAVLPRPRGGRLDARSSGARCSARRLRSIRRVAVGLGSVRCVAGVRVAVLPRPRGGRLDACSSGARCPARRLGGRGASSSRRSAARGFERGGAASSAGAATRGIGRRRRSSPSPVSPPVSAPPVSPAPTSSEPLVIDVSKESAPERTEAPMPVDASLSPDLSRSTSSVVVEEALAAKQTHEALLAPGSSPDAGATDSHEFAEPLVDVEDASPPKKRRMGIIAIAAALLLSCVVLLGVRLTSERTATHRTASPPDTAVPAAPSVPETVSSPAATGEIAPGDPSAASAAAVGASTAAVAADTPLAPSPELPPSPNVESPAAEGSAKQTPGPRPTRRYEPLGI